MMRRLFAAALSVSLLADAHAQVRVIPIPDHPVFGRVTPRRISGDGRHVVGFAGGAPVVWTIDEGFDECSDPLVRRPATASGISFDGSVVAGLTSLGGSQIGFRWVRGPGGGVVTLLTGLPGQLRLNSVTAISRDGSTVIGDVPPSQNADRAAFWTQDGGTVVIPSIPGLPPTRNVSDVSNDHSTMIGTFNEGIPFVWNVDSGTSLVPTPPGTTRASRIALTSLGDVIIGTGSSPAQPGGTVPFTWNPETGPWLIPEIEGNYSSIIRAANADGRLAVGVANDLSPADANLAIVYTLGTEIVFLGDYLALFGSTHPNSDFQDAFDISDDGFAILGSGGIAPFWVALIAPAPISDYNRNNFIDFTDLTDFLDAFEGIGSLPSSSADLNRDGFTDFFDLIEFLDNF